MKPGSRQNRFRSLTISIVSRLFAALITISFAATFLPIASVSADKTNAMACCIGKSAGHCDSGLPAKPPPPPKPEPMCGLKTAGLDDDAVTDVVTIVAEPSHTESHHSSQTPETASHYAAESASLGKLCQTDCCACLAGFSRQQREKETTQPNAPQSSLSRNLSQAEISSLFSSNEDWEQTSPRGPPVSLL